MARVTIEDCLENVDNRFELVLVASKRARQLAKGIAEPLVEVDNDKPTVLALREIADEDTRLAALAKQRREQAERWCKSCGGPNDSKLEQRWNGRKSVFETIKPTMCTKCTPTTECRIKLF